MAAAVNPNTDGTNATDVVGGYNALSFSNFLGAPTHTSDTPPGGGAFSLDGGMGMNMLIGFLDAGDLAALIGGTEYLTMLRSMTPQTRDMEVEITPDAFEHRGVKYLKTLVTNDGAPNPMMPNGVMESYAGAVGSYMVAAATAAVTKQITDSVIDHKIQRAALPDGAVLTVDVRLGAMMKAMAASLRGMASGEGLPEQVGLTVVPSGRQLSLRVRSR